MYSLLGKDISGALQGVGWTWWWLSARRPTGRDSLAQDILKNSAWWADRLVLSLINRGQIKPQDFVTEASGAVSLKADARKLCSKPLQAKKQEKIVHPFLGRKWKSGCCRIFRQCCWRATCVGIWRNTRRFDEWVSAGRLKNGLDVFRRPQS